MQTRIVKVVNKLGLHARPASKLRQTASRFACDVRIRYGDVVCDAKSVLGVLTLAAPFGSELTLEAEGEDAQACLDALAALFASGFGENE